MIGILESSFCDSQFLKTNTPDYYSVNFCGNDHENWHDSTGAAYSWRSCVRKVLLGDGFPEGTAKAVVDSNGTCLTARSLLSDGFDGFALLSLFPKVCSGACGCSGTRGLQPKAEAIIPVICLWAVG